MTQRKQDIAEDFTIGDLEAGDIACLIPVIRSWVQYRGEVIEAEVNQIVEMLRSDLKGSNRVYLVARDARGKAVGVTGCGEVHARMACFQSVPDARASGLVIAFVSSDCRGKGVGKSLLLALFDRARQAGWTEMIWSSNPRYRETAWQFYTGIAGEPVGKINDLFEPGSISPAWRKKF